MILWIKLKSNVNPVTSRTLRCGNLSNIVNIFNSFVEYLYILGFSITFKCSIVAPSFNAFDIPFSIFFNNFALVFDVNINSKYFKDVSFDNTPLI